MPIAYSPANNVIIGNCIAIGVQSSGGHQWERRPDYLITCRCGQPLRAYFPNLTPYPRMNDFGIGNHPMFDYWLVRYGMKAWGFRIADGRYCPKCRNQIYFGADAQTAIWNYLKIEFDYQDGERARMFDAVKELADNITKGGESFRRYFGLQYEQLTGRGDCCLVVAPGTPIKIEERIKR